VGSLTQAQLQAAAEFGTAAIQAFDHGGMFPAETVIGSVARMAGSFLLRSLGLPLSGIDPGAAVLSERANEQGPRLVQVLAAVLHGIGVKLDESRLASAQSAARGQKDSVLQTQEALGRQFT
jgi:hypothetical protein